ncbi:MAG: polymerase III subunit beta protein [Parcubacteria group bacterium GW2011_GWA1_36_12]|nr:MAG: polymerase III subunit beta protein [Parcubacteria group bacterium GW2011_GWA1_36_12]
MKITILKEKLQEGLNAISRIVGKNTSLPILSNVLIESDSNTIILSATDLEIGIKYRILSRVDKKGKVAIPLVTFLGVVGALPKKPINIESESTLLIVKSENFEINIKGLPVEDFPIIPNLINGETVNISASVFCDAISSVCDLASTSSIRPEISGVLVSFLGKTLKTVATDSFRLAEKSVSCGIDLGSHSFILPQRSAKEVVGIFGGKDSVGELKITLDQNQISIESLPSGADQSTIYLTSKIIDGEYPNYKEIIPSSGEAQVVLDRGGFLDQIKLASFFCGKTGEVRLGIDNKRGGLSIYSQNQESGEHSSFLPGQVKGKGDEASFNCRFLLDGLSKIKSSEVVFELTKRNGDLGPGVLKPIGDQSFIYILMPLNLG